MYNKQQLKPLNPKKNTEVNRPKEAKQEVKV